MSKYAPKVRPLADLLLCFVGPSVWTAYFMVMYGANAFVCSKVDADTRAGPFLSVAAIATALVLVGLAGFLGWCLAAGRSGSRRRAAADRSTFTRDVAVVLAMVSMLATAWVALPAVLLPPCAGWSG